MTDHEDDWSDMDVNEWELERAQQIESYAKQLAELDDDVDYTDIVRLISHLTEVDRNAALDRAIALVAEPEPKVETYQKVCFGCGKPLVPGMRCCYLVPPLTIIKGIGPKKVEAILLARKLGKPLPPGLQKLLDNPKTDLDSLSPIEDRIKTLHPDLTAIGIQSRVMPINKVQCGIEGPVVIAGVAMRIAPRDENDLQKVAKRGYKFSGPTTALNMFVRDDSGEIFAKINRYDFERLATPIIECGRAGKAIYALKGTVPPDFRMISVQRIIYLGDMAVKYVAPVAES